MTRGIVEKALSVSTRLRTVLFTWLMASQFKTIGAGTRISPPFRSANLRGVQLGAHVMINRDCWIQVVPGSDATVVPELIIKSHAKIGMGSSISAAGRVVIGEYALLARNVYISDHGHAFEDVNTPILDQGITKPMEVEVGDCTWIGQNACVLPGEKIGRHCVVGANAVVRESVPDYTVVAGVPARAIRRYNVATKQWERCA